MSILAKAADYLLGEKVGNSDTRHRPSWLPRRFDKRWLDERLAVMTLPPYKPPYQRHIRIKAWVCAGPNYILHANVIAEVDIDDRQVSVEVYR